jgi:hypothetical protein
MARLTKEDLRFFIEQEWKDIHHTRIQEWTALGLVAGVHFAMLQFFTKEGISEYFKNYGFWLPCIGAVFAIVGIILTCHHRKVMMRSYQWLVEAEKRIGLIQ